MRRDRHQPGFNGIDQGGERSTNQQDTGAEGTGVHVRVRRSGEDPGKNRPTATDHQQKEHFHG